MTGLEADLRKAKAENARLRGDVVHVPLLRSVPMQSTGEHDRLPMAGEEWDAVWNEGKP